MFTMNEKKTVSEVRLDDSRTLIESASVPLSDAVVCRIEEVIETEARDIKSAMVTAVRAELHAARAEAALANTARAEDEALLATAEIARSVLEGGSRLLSVLFALCAAACLSAEFTLTLVTLPFILGIRQWSFLGVTLALAPTTAVIILDKVFGRLIEEPWRALRHTAGRGVRRWAAVGVMALFMACLGAGNVYTVVALAGAREHATEMRRALESGRDDLLTPEKIAAHRVAINIAILAVSVFVTLDGACFSLLGLIEFRQLRAANAANRLVERLRASRATARGASGKAGASLAMAESRWEAADELGGIEADRYRAERMFRLAEARSRTPPERSSADLVKSILSGRAGANPGAARAA
jgi:hypothetical protein